MSNRISETTVKLDYQIDVNETLPIEIDAKGLWTRADGWEYEIVGLPRFDIPSYMKDNPKAIASLTAEILDSLNYDGFGADEIPEALEADAQ